MDRVWVCLRYYTYSSTTEAVWPLCKTVGVLQCTSVNNFHLHPIVVCTVSAYLTTVLHYIFVLLYHYVVIDLCVLTYCNTPFPLVINVKNCPSSHSGLHPLCPHTAPMANKCKIIYEDEEDEDVRDNNGSLLAKVFHALDTTEAQPANDVCTTIHNIKLTHTVAKAVDEPAEKRRSGHTGKGSREAFNTIEDSGANPD